MNDLIEMLRHELAGGFLATPFPVAVLRLLAALVLGGALGMERQVRHKSAGLRTHMLIAIAACLFTLITLELMVLPGDETRMRTDPLRLISAITSGVAFLGAGTIITHGAQVRGLTTGAGMWLAGAVGVACGIGNIPMAGLATLLALIVLEVLRRLEKGDAP